MRLRQQNVGAMNLFDTREQDLSASDAGVAQALADVATIAILQHRTIAHGNIERAQLRAALSSRICIEQAKASWPNAGTPPSTTPSMPCAGTPAPTSRPCPRCAGS